VQVTHAKPAIARGWVGPPHLGRPNAVLKH